MHEHLWKPFAGALTRTRSGVAAPACAPVRSRRAECASRKKSPTPIGAVFVITAQALELLQENPCGYGARVSGATIYSYVGGDPVSFTDPTGKIVFVPALIYWGVPLIAGTWWVATHPISLPTYANPQPMQASFPPGYWPGDRGAKEWGRRNECGPDEGKRRFHRGVKQGDNMSGARDAYGVNPETGDVIDPAGESVGNLHDIGQTK